MTRGTVAILALLLSGTASAADTDFGVRTVGRVPSARAAAALPMTPRAAGSTSLAGAVAFAGRMGRVTSSYRSPEHNRAVGGVRNSYHLLGRAVDVVRRPGVRHRDLEAALVAAGYRLRESLDEGDHSHFAFDFNGRGGVPVRKSPAEALGGLTWKIVYAPNVHGE